MLDVSLFRNLRFSAASGSIMVIFFALAGFVFLMYIPLGYYTDLALYRRRQRQKAQP